MKFLIILVVSSALSACKNPAEDHAFLQARLDSLQYRLDHTYKPGLGEFMSSIQVHHAKLWFAGKNQNWELADFETSEMKELLGDIREYCKDRPEIKSLDIIEPALDSIGNAIQQKSLLRFKNSFLLLTNSCNNCHQATQHGFNVIQIPGSPPFDNQNFSAPGS